MRGAESSDKLEQAEGEWQEREREQRGGESAEGGVYFVGGYHSITVDDKFGSRLFGRTHSLHASCATPDHTHPLTRVWTTNRWE